MIRLTLLIGLPGSGKSTLAKKLLAENPQRELISTDAIRAALFGAEIIQGDWQQVREQVQRQFEQAVQKIAAKEAKAAIYDATNAARQHRLEAIALARSAGFNYISGIWVDAPVELCLQRNQQRDRQVPPEVILHMQAQLQAEPPSLQDGFDYFIRRQSV